MFYEVLVSKLFKKSPKFEDGILCLCIPKKDAKTIEENKYISIE